MANLSTKYLGLTLNSPIIVSSSGLTKSVNNIKKAEQLGAGAVVLKSLFEEQIRYESNKTLAKSENIYTYPEAEDYIKNYVKQHNLDEYLNLISGAKKEVKIPVIASINCISAHEWTDFAKKIEQAGADALELNVFILPCDTELSGINVEDIYFDIVEEVKKQVSIPISLKISYYFSSFAKFSQKLSWTGIQGLVFFNRFFSLDIDAKAEKIVPAHVYSSPEELSIPLRWIAIMANKVNCDISASTGIHDSIGIVKALLAGAKATQICSVLYKNGLETIKSLNSGLEKWMKEHKYNTIDEFRGKLAQQKNDNAAVYSRVQFMKHHAGIE